MNGSLNVTVEVIEDVEDTTSGGTVTTPNTLITATQAFSTVTTSSGVYYVYDLNAIETMIKDNCDGVSVLHY